MALDVSVGIGASDASGSSVGVTVVIVIPLDDIRGERAGRGSGAAP